MVVKPITLLMGGDQVLLEKAIQAVSTKLFPSGAPVDLNTHRYDATEASLGDLITQSDTAPFLAPKRLIILKSINKFSPKQKTSLTEYLQRKSDFSHWILITSETKPDRSKFLTGLSRMAHVEICQAKREADVHSFINSELRRSKKTIAREALAILLAEAGKDLTLIAARLEQLCLMSKDRAEISLEDVKALCGEPLTDNIFILYEALQSGQFELAYRTVHQLLEQRKPLELLGAFVWQVERVMRVRQLIQAGLNPREIALKLKIHSYFFEGVMRQARRLTQTQAEQQLAALARCDAEIKQGKLTPELAFEKCLLGFNEVQASCNA